jgi:hypothetical protein
VQPGGSHCLYCSTILHTRTGCLQELDGVIERPYARQEDLGGVYATRSSSCNLYQPRTEQACEDSQVGEEEGELAMAHRREFRLQSPVDGSF